MARLTGKVAIVTGAASGMGVEHARQFVEEGAKVTLTDILEDAGTGGCRVLRVRMHSSSGTTSRIQSLGTQWYLRPVIISVQSRCS